MISFARGFLIRFSNCFCVEIECRRSFSSSQFPRAAKATEFTRGKSVGPTTADWSNIGECKAFPSRASLYASRRLFRSNRMSEMYRVLARHRYTTHEILSSWSWNFVETFRNKPRCWNHTLKKSLLLLYLILTLLSLLIFYSNIMVIFVICKRFFYLLISSSLLSLLCFVRFLKNAQTLDNVLIVSSSFAILRLTRLIIRLANYSRLHEHDPSSRLKNFIPTASCCTASLIDEELTRL